MLHCPFCSSNDVDPKFWLSEDNLGNIESGPGCMNCGSTAETIEKWNKRPRCDECNYGSKERNAKKHAIWCKKLNDYQSLFFNCYYFEMKK